MQHGGNSDGTWAMVALIPEEHIGVVVLTNMNGTLLRDALISLTNGAVTGATLEQPAPRPTLKLMKEG